MIRNVRGLKRYEPLLQTICQMYDYHQLTEREWEGCLGVACTISVLEDVPSTIFALAKHLEISHNDENLKNAFDRLKINGIFSNKYNVKRDPALNGNAVDSDRQISSEIERNAWCNVAGIAGGFVGMVKIESILKKEESNDHEKE